jgi:hypothetical protein
MTSNPTIPETTQSTSFKTTHSLSISNACGDLGKIGHKKIADEYQLIKH